MSPEPSRVFNGEDDETTVDSEFPIDPDAGEKSAPPDPEPKDVVVNVPAEPQAEEPAGTSKRNYVIFKQISEDTFKKIAVVNHTTSDGAVESLGDIGLEDGASYAAPPERYWNPKQAKVEKTTTITLG